MPGRRKFLAGFGGSAIGACVVGTRRAAGGQTNRTEPSSGPSGVSRAAEIPYGKGWTTTTDLGSTDRPIAATAASDGGCYVLVRQPLDSPDTRPTVVVRVTDGGEIAWRQGVSAGIESVPTGFTSAPDGGVIVAGRTDVEDPDSDEFRGVPMAAGIGSDGQLRFSRVYDPPDEGSAYAAARIGGTSTLWERLVSFDGGPDAVAARRIDGSGNQLEQRVYDFDGYPKKAVKMADDGAVIGGSLFREESYFTLRVDAEGDPVWRATVDEGYWPMDGLARHPRGGVVVVGKNEQSETFVARITAGGTVDWVRYPDDLMYDCESIAPTPDGDLLVGGRFNDGDSRDALAKLSPAGETQWSRNITSWRSVGISGMVVDADGDVTVASYGAPDKRNDANDLVVRRRYNRAPDPAIEVSTNPVNGTTVTLSAESSTDPGGELDELAWDLDGDGEYEATGDRVEHRFSSGGDHEVTLRAVDTMGKEATTTKTVRVNTPTPSPTPSPSATASPADDDAASSAETSSSVPGFGVGAALVGLAGGAVARVLRTDE